MKVVSIGKPVDRVAAEAELLEKMHEAISEFAGILTVVQVLGLLEVCKMEVVEQNQ